eukprot:Skav201696  [mRNA]  locus=scaffold641:892063:896476:- [translate_table: standard]
MVEGVKRRVVYTVVSLAVVVATLVCGFGENAQLKQQRYAFLGLDPWLAMAGRFSTINECNITRPFGGKWWLSPWVDESITTEMFQRRWVNVVVVAMLTLLLWICFFKPHPPSICAYDAKCCIFGNLGHGIAGNGHCMGMGMGMGIGMRAGLRMWMVMMVYQVFEVGKGMQRAKLPGYDTVKDRHCAVAGWKTEHRSVTVFSMICLII